MPYVAPRTWVVPDAITAARLNQDLRDNVAFLANPPKVRAYNSAAISTTTATATLITLDSERYDTDTMHSTATNTGRITFTTAGTYRYTARIAFASGAGDYREVKIRLGGATDIDLDSRGVAGGGNYTTCICTGEYAFTAGQYIEMFAYQNSGGNLNVVVAGNYSPEFSAVWVSL